VTTDATKPEIKTKNGSLLLYYDAVLPLLNPRVVALQISSANDVHNVCDFVDDCSCGFPEMTRAKKSNREDGAFVASDCR